MRICLAVDLTQTDIPVFLDKVLNVLGQFEDPTIDVVYADGPTYAEPLLFEPAALSIFEKHAELVRKQNRQRLRDLVALIPEEMRGVPLHRYGGDTAEELCEAGADHDLLVIFSHGRRGMERFLLGSIAEKVVRKSTVPVLVLHPW